MNTKNKNSIILLFILLLSFIGFNHNIYAFSFVDINKDGNFNILDVKLVVNHIVAKQTLSSDELTNADYNNDGDVKMDDAMSMLIEINKSSASIIDSCSGTINSQELRGMHGTAMLDKNYYDSSNMGMSKGKMTPGEIFEILGENGDNWAINYNESCVWVDSTYMAINLKEYIPSITYNITNATASIFKSSGKDIPGLTGEKLYSDEFKTFVPATYPFAIKLKRAQEEALTNGDSIVVYEAYRPNSVTKYSSNKFISLLNSDSEVWKNVQYSTGKSGATYTWGYNYFLAPNLSTHNTGCAADVSLKKINGSEYEMPSAMHELSTAAIKYYSASAAHTESNYSVGMQASEGAQKLSDYMMNAGGLTDLSSEWWHYQDNTCYHSIYTGVDFWSNVSS